MGADSEIIEEINGYNGRFLGIMAHDPEAALALHDKAKALSEKAGYVKGELDASLNRAWYHIFRCEFDPVFSLIKDLPEKYEHLGDNYGRLKAINALGALHLDMGNYENGLPYFLKSLTLSRKFGEKEREATALANIGLLYCEVGRIEEAYGYLNSALDISEIHPSSFYTAARCLGRYYHETGQIRTSRMFLEHVGRIAGDNRDLYFESEILTTLGSVNRSSGEYDAAQKNYSKSLEISRQLDNVRLETANLYEMGQLCLVTGDLDTAFDLLKQAMENAEKKQLGYFKCQSYLQISRLFEQRKEYFSALEYLKKVNAAEKEYNLEKTELKLKSIGFEYALEAKKQQAEMLKQKNAELERANRKILALANHDNLTGLPNRRLFMEHLKSSVHSAARADGKFALFFIDLDNFKPVNDRFGHRAGDTVLKEVSGRLSRVLRKSDIVARFGGDEFVILVQDLKDLRYARTVADKIIRLFDRDFHIDEYRCTLGTSIGISIYPDDGTDVENLLIRADKAMYAAKLNGKNTYMFSRVFQ